MPHQGLGRGKAFPPGAPHWRCRPTRGGADSNGGAARRTPARPTRAAVGAAVAPRRGGEAWLLYGAPPVAAEIPTHIVWSQRIGGRHTILYDPCGAAPPPAAARSASRPRPRGAPAARVTPEADAVSGVATAPVRGRTRVSRAAARAAPSAGVWGARRAGAPAAGRGGRPAGRAAGGAATVPATPTSGNRAHTSTSSSRAPPPPGRRPRRRPPRTAGVHSPASRGRNERRASSRGGGSSSAPRCRRIRTDGTPPPLTRADAPPSTPATVRRRLHEIVNGRGGDGRAPPPRHPLPPRSPPPPAAAEPSAAAAYGFPPASPSGADAASLRPPPPAVPPASPLSPAAPASESASATRRRHRRPTGRPLRQSLPRPRRCQGGRPPHQPRRRRRRRRRDTR